jgi:hypothetical protein
MRGTQLKVPRLRSNAGLRSAPCAFVPAPLPARRRFDFRLPILCRDRTTVGVIVPSAHLKLSAVRSLLLP